MTFVCGGHVMPVQPLTWTAERKALYWDQKSNSAQVTQGSQCV